MAHNFVLLAPRRTRRVRHRGGHGPRDRLRPRRKKARCWPDQARRPGETVEVTFDAPKAPGVYTFICTFPGHFLAGMKGTLTVK